MLCLHKGAVRIKDREQLAEVETPRGRGRWKPIPHIKLANAVVQKADRLGLEIAGEEWALSKDGAKMFGVLNFKRNDRFQTPQGMMPSLGLRSSLDKSIAINFCGGTRVFVCDNGVFAGDFTVRKLHTTGFDMTETLNVAFRRFGKQQEQIGVMVGQLQECRLSDNKAKLLMFDAFQAEVMPWTYLKDVQQEYFEPRHKEFKPRNAWSMYNAFTEVVKQRGPNDQVKTFRKLNELLMAAAERN